MDHNRPKLTKTKSFLQKLRFRKTKTMSQLKIDGESNINQPESNQVSKEDISKGESCVETHAIHQSNQTSNSRRENEDIDLRSSIVQDLQNRQILILDDLSRGKVFAKILSWRVVIVGSEGLNIAGYRI